MKLIIGFAIFCLVLFFYLHIQFHLKTGDDLEMYELEETSKDKLEEICDLRQPVLFDYEIEELINNTNKSALASMYDAFDVKIRNINEPQTTNSALYVPLKLSAAAKLFAEDKQSAYLTERNDDFLTETGADKQFRYNDAFLRPHMVSNCIYDVMFGSAGAWTPFRCELNYRNYFMVTHGSVKVKMAPPKSAKYLRVINDYDNFEFRSPINPWKPDADLDKVKCLEFTLTKGKTLFIPAYWYYSIQFIDDASVSALFYRTYMNNLAMMHHTVMYALQLHNVKHEIVKKLEI
jgi:hypothetical protein